MAFDSVRGEVVLFGGRVTFPTNDTWVWNGATWSLRMPATSPPARVYHAMAFDAVRGNVVVFAGAGLELVPVTRSFDWNDTWTWDGTTWTLVTAPGPPARNGHAMTFDSDRKEVLLFGGGTQNDTLLGDTWVWNGASWTQRAPALSPAGRVYHAMAYDPGLQRAVLFGGFTGTNTRKNDTWTWNGTTWMLQPATNDATSAPPPLAGHAMAFDTQRGHVLLSSGYDPLGPTSDVWEWSGIAWQRRAGAPARRYLGAATFDQVRNQVLLFGGLGVGNGSSSAQLDDTWTWDGSVWRRATTTTRPPPRRAHALVYDSTRKNVLLFGGISTVRYNDTWAWDGTNWTALAPGHRPNARSAPVMVDDKAHGKVVLFGGAAAGMNGTTVALDDTWTWDGTDWTEQTPVAHPPARIAAAGAFDPTNGTVVLFGGTTGTFEAFFSDTWVWDNVTWTQKTAALAPPARGYHGITLDTNRREIILFAGATNATDFRDTWVWNSRAASWFERPLTGSVPARNAFTLTYDEVRGELMAFGGLRGTNEILQDTWLNITLGGTCTSNAQCARVNAFCTDGVCCLVSACGTCQTCAGVTPGKCNDVLNAEDADSCPRAEGKTCSGTAECKAALGSTPATAAECASGFLVDGVCCETNRCDPCFTCDITKKALLELPGRCGPSRVGTDPHEECIDEGSIVCNRDGSCNGRGACELYKAGTGCGTSVCIGSRATGQICSGSGVCDANPRGIECSPFACRNNDGCLRRCTTREECAALHRCDNGTCVPDQGVTCEDGHTLFSATGERVDCGNYRCEGSACRTTCVTSSDCTGSADCSGDGRCVPFIERPVVDSRCALAKRQTTPLNGLLALSVIFASKRFRKGKKRAETRACVRRPRDDA